MNKALEGHDFILIGPGPLGISQHSTGVQVSYADIYNARRDRVTVPQQGITPSRRMARTSFGIWSRRGFYPLTVYPEEAGDYLNCEFIERARNCLAGWRGEAYADCVKVIHVPAERHGQRLDILMDNQRASHISSTANRRLPCPTKITRTATLPTSWAQARLCCPRGGQRRAGLAGARAQKPGGAGALSQNPADVILYWPRSSSEITPTLIELRQAITPNGGI